MRNHSLVAIGLSVAATCLLSRATVASVTNPGAAEAQSQAKPADGGPFEIWLADQSDTRGPRPGRPMAGSS